MEIVDFLQLVLLLGLLIAVAILLFSFHATRRLHEKRDEDEATKRNELRSGPDRVASLPRNAPIRQLARRLAS